MASTRIPRSEVLWRGLPGGNVRHAVVAAEPPNLRTLCPPIAYAPRGWWTDFRTDPECAACARRVEPAPNTKEG
jgi:hypothetical protein